jgi:phosphoribosylamine-glycine ligase
LFVLTDGKSYKQFPTAKDYKRIGEGDTGLNTGEGFLQFLMLTLQWKK